MILRTLAYKISTHGLLWHMKLEENIAGFEAGCLAGYPCCEIRRRSSNWLAFISRDDRRACMAPANDSHATKGAPITLIEAAARKIILGLGHYGPNSLT